MLAPDADVSVLAGGERRRIALCHRVGGRLAVLAQARGKTTRETN